MNTKKIVVISLLIGVALLAVVLLSLDDNDRSAREIQQTASEYVITEDWTYAIQSETGSKDEADGVSVDSQGNVFIGGLFHDTVMFNRAPRTAKSGSDIFVTKLDPDGNELWFETFDFGSNDFLWDLTVDQDDNLIISGAFGGSIGPTSQTQDATNGITALFAKLSGTTGEVLWQRTATAESVGGMSGAGGNEVIVDSENAIISTMMASGDRYIIDGVSYEGIGRKDGFVIKRNQDGEIDWVYQFYGNAFNQVRAIGVTEDGHITFGLEYIGAITDQAGNKLLSSESGRTAQGAFGMLSAEGELLWMHAVGSNGFANVRGAGGDAFGNGYYTGVVTGSAMIGDESVKVSKKGTSFLAKYDSNGNQIWLRLLGNNESDEGGELIVFGNNVALTGSNNGADYNVFTSADEVLFEDIFSTNARVLRASFAIFDLDGNVRTTYTPQKTDTSSGGVLEYAVNECVLFQHSFYGKISYYNGDSYSAPNTEDIPGFPYNKDQVVTKLCLDAGKEN